jgi:glycine cleavage system H lipoate-binding protein
MTALFITGAIVSLLLLDRFVIQPLERRGLKPADLAERIPLPASIPVAPGRFYGLGHTAVALTENGEARISLDGFARHAFGEPERVELPRPGLFVERGAPIVTALREGRRMEVRSPLSGTVSAVRPDGEDGWLVSLTPTRMGREFRALLVAEEAVAWLRDEFTRFREFLVDGLSLSPATLPDGGLPAEGALQYLPDEMLAEFEAEFLAIEVTR